MLQLEWVREHLNKALLNIILPRENSSGSRIYPEKRDAQIYTKPTREIELEKKTITVPIDPMHCTEGRKYKGSRVLVSPEMYALASWRRAVMLLPPSYQAWTRYCYGDSTAFDGQITICTHVWAAFQIYQHEIGAPRMSKKIEEAIQRLVWLALQERKQFLTRGQYRYCSADLARLCGVSPDNWAHNYQPRWAALMKITERLDREALIYAEQEQRTESRMRRYSAVSV